MPAPDFARCRTQVTPRSTSATTMTAIAANVERLARMTPTTMNATKIHGHDDPGSAFFGGGSVIVYQLLSIEATGNE